MTSAALRARNGCNGLRPLGGTSGRPLALIRPGNEAAPLALRAQARREEQGPPIGIKISCAGGAPPCMKVASLLLTWFRPEKDFQKNLSLEARQEAGWSVGARAVERMLGGP